MLQRHFSQQSACRINKATSRAVRHGSQVPVRERPINRVRENPACQPAPPNKCRSSEKTKILCTGEQSIARDHQLSLARFTSRCKLLLRVTFLNFHKSSGYGTPSTCRLARFTSGSIARDRPAQKLEVRIRARSAWRCATPCCFPALPPQRGMPLP